MNAPIQTHEDPLLFREAINFTATQTRFLPRLIEKDYFCTLLLNYLAAADAARAGLPGIQYRIRFPGSEGGGLPAGKKQLCMMS